MSKIHSGLSIPELVKFIKHSFRESEFHEVENALTEREKIMKKEIDFLKNTQSFAVLEKRSMEEKIEKLRREKLDVEEKLGSSHRKCEEMEERLSEMGKEIEDLRREKLGIEEKLGSSHGKCEEMEERLFEMGKEIEDLRCNKIDANQTTEELKRKEIEVQELKLKNAEANQTIDELRVKKMESDKAAEVFESNLTDLDPRILMLETKLAKMLSVNVEDFPYLIHGNNDVPAATVVKEYENVKLPKFVKGGSDGLENCQANADDEDSHRAGMSPQVPATTGHSAGSGDIGLTNKGGRNMADPGSKENGANAACTYPSSDAAHNSTVVGSNGTAKENEGKESEVKGLNASVRQSGGEVATGKSELSSSAARNVIVICDSDDEAVPADTMYISDTSSGQTNKRNRTGCGDDSTINWSRKRKTSTSSSLPSRVEEIACDSQLPLQKLSDSDDESCSDGCIDNLVEALKIKRERERASSECK